MVVRHVLYKKEKFRELIVYIAAKSADDPTFGDVKLNKLLHFSDFVAYGDLGEPITGARYHKQPLGPTAIPLLPVREELVDEGVLEVTNVPAGTKQRTVTIALREPDESLFSDEELEIVDELIRIFHGKPASLISEVSHMASAGWNLVSMDEEIPYATALIDTGPPPDEILALGRELAQRHGW